MKGLESVLLSVAAQYPTEAKAVARYLPVKLRPAAQGLQGHASLDGQQRKLRDSLRKWAGQISFGGQKVANGVAAQAGIVLSPSTKAVPVVKGGLALKVASSKKRLIAGKRIAKSVVGKVALKTAVRTGRG